MVRQGPGQKKIRTAFHYYVPKEELWYKWLQKKTFQYQSFFWQPLKEACMAGMFWWIRQVVLILIGAFFLYYGIQLLISSYDLKDPFIFIMTFFAANFIVLISATIVFGFAYRIFIALRQSKKIGGK